MFQVGLPMLPGIELRAVRVSINVNKTRKHFSRNIQGARMFPHVSQFPMRELLGAFHYAKQTGQRSVGAFHYAKVTGQRSVGKMERHFPI